jgi:glycosyltransferase involved in cell wall biosynthesis
LSTHPVLTPIFKKASADRVISIIVPAHRADQSLIRCLHAIRASCPAAAECVVVDDGSPDAEVSSAAGDCGFRSVRLDSTRGPAAARNLGAAVAVGDVLLFLDADVLVRRDIAAEVEAFLDTHSDVAAVFGSYDDEPEDDGLVSQYKNLTHHFVHQNGREAAFTFWAGCGAIRRSAFLQAGGFDERYDRPCIEDIELGQRLRGRGERIALLKTLTATHLKRWTFWDAVRIDVADRGVPWTELLLSRPDAARSDLNLDWRHVASVFLMCAFVVSAVLATWTAAGGVVAVCAAVGFVTINGRYLFWLAAKRNWWFALRVLPLYALHHLCNGLSIAAGVARWVGRRFMGDSVEANLPHPGAARTGASLAAPEGPDSRA